MSDGEAHEVPHGIEELMEILETCRRMGEFPGLELVCGCLIWINPDQVASVRPT